MEPHPASTRRIYLDHAATTPVRAEVEEALRPFLSEGFGNPSSLYAEGVRAREALEEARERIRGALGARDFEVVFTGSGTESDNAALVGCALAARERRGDAGPIVTSAVEHRAVLATRHLLEHLGCELVTVGVDGDGRVAPDDFGKHLDGAVLVSVMCANNEVGTLEPIEPIGRLARRRGVPVHTDAVQAVGKLPLRLDESPLDLVTLSGHKVYAPKGVGALLVRRGLEVAPILRGGSQQAGRRAGTEAVALAVALARAIELAEAEREAEAARLESLRERLRREISARFPSARFNTPREGALPGILNVSFPSVEGESLVRLLDAEGVAASTGSACSVGSGSPSHVLEAMGRDRREVRGSLRLSLGRLNTAEDVEPFLERLERTVGKLESIAP